MTTEPPITGYQLIFTNVEADRSPTRQRGFQVWLCSPELAPEQRRAVAKRLDDFRLPPGVPQSGEIVRHVFFRTPDGLFVIARTVPLAERDKFGRGGKFHAHALILSDDAFRRLGCHPFRVIDGGFRFHSHPDEAAVGEEWRSGNLPMAEIRPAEPAADSVPLPPERLAELLHHVERDDERPVAITDRPERVLAVLRECFRTFPPCVRQRLEFDTLSTGAFLGHVKYAVVGAYSPESLKTWVFRRYHRLDLATGTCTPPLDRPAVPLPGELIRTAGWGELGDEDRESLYQEVRALTESKIDELRPDRLSPAAAEVLAKCPGIRGAIDAAIRTRLVRDVPAALVGLPAVVSAARRHFDQPVAETLALLAHPVPNNVISAAITESLETSLQQPTPEILAGLGEWVARGSADQRLELICRRWRGTADDFRLLEQVLADPESPTRGWLPGWLHDTLPTELRDLQRAPEFLMSRLAIGRATSPALLRDARLFLALNPDAESPAAVELRLLTAYHQGIDALGVLLSGPHRLAGVEKWLVRSTAACLADRCTPGWMSDGLGGTFLGLFLVPAGAAEELLLDACVSRAIPPLQLIAALWPDYVTCAGAGGETEPDPPDAAKKRYQAVLAAEPKHLADAVRELRDYLACGDDVAYSWTANLLLQKVYGEPVLQGVSDEVYVLGLRLVWVQFDRPGAFTGLFEAIAGAAVPEIAPGETPNVPGSLGDRAPRRFSWLLARLADPTGTERLPL